MICKISEEWDAAKYCLTYETWWDNVIKQVLDAKTYLLNYQVTKLTKPWKVSSIKIQVIPRNLDLKSYAPLTISHKSSSLWDELSHLTKQIY